MSEKRAFHIEQTEAQTLGQQQEAEELSLRSTAPPATLPGYRLERFLGAGTFGQVWYGHNLNTGRPVAVKFYLHRGGVNWSLLSREVRNLVQLSADRSVVQVLDVGWDAEPPYYVMEYLPSGSLEDLLASRGRLQIEEAVTMFRQICVGLNHCHGKGILHCDLKPANVMLDSDMEPRLADFGQSRMSNDQSPSLGTLFYMAPEQAMMEAVPDARWDVYALGTILYRMLTGKVPHRNPSLVNQIDTAGSLGRRLEHYRDAILNDKVPDDHRTRRGVDRMLASIVDKCLAPDASQRFANVQQILAALDKRDEAKAKRPLMLLGIVGPLLLMAATGFFAARSVSAASKNAVVALRTEAHGSNQLAARFAARTLENELQDYFTAVRREAASSSMRRAMQELLASTDLTTMRDRLASRKSSETDPEEQHQQFLRHPDRVALDQLLNERLSMYQAGTADDRPKLATMFVTDRYGTIVSIAYGDPVPDSQNSAGRNFAYRSYFNGQANDLSPNTLPTEVSPLAKTHLSAPFPSTATGLWKVAFSTPIYDRSASDDEQPRNIIGVFVATTNLGDFQLLRAEDQAKQLAVVIDARPGSHRGTVLQHPLMNADQPISLPAGERFQVPSDSLDHLLEGSDIDYRDPLAQAPGGEGFKGSWLAAVAPVKVPSTFEEIVSGRDPEDDSAEMLVLVQYRLATVLEPVGQLEKQLYTEGAFLLASIVIVTLIMWYFVNRVQNEARHDEIQESPQPNYARTMTLK